MRVFYLDNIISHNFLKLMTETIENSRALNYVIFLIFERYVEIIIIRAKKFLFQGESYAIKTEIWYIGQKISILMDEENTDDSFYRHL